MQLIDFLVPKKVICVLRAIGQMLIFGFGVFKGVKLGTVLCALINGFLIGRFTKLLEHHFEFRNKLNIERYFL